MARRKTTKAKDTPVVDPVVEPEKDEETERLLAELEAGSATPEQEPETVEPEQELETIEPEQEPETVEEIESVTITNAGKNLRRIDGLELAVGDSHTLTEDQMGNAPLMAKVERMIELSIFTRG